MKNVGINLKEKLVAKYFEKDKSQDTKKSTDINVLLNRVKSNQKNETKKKLYFSALASTGLLLFGFIVF